MAAENETYISDLDQIIEIKPADSFIVETTEGTKRILWQNIIIGQDNVDFYNLITQNQVDVLALSSSVTSLSSTQETLVNDVQALSAADIVRDQYGFAYIEIEPYPTRNLLTLKKSDNITDITSNGTVITFTLNDTNIDMTEASIIVTFNYGTSSNLLTESYQTYTPVVLERGSGTFKVAVDTFVHTVQTLNIVTGASLILNSQSQAVATGATGIYTGSLTLSGLGTYDIDPDVVKNVSTATTSLDYVDPTGTSISTTSNTLTFQSIEALGTSQFIQGNLDTAQNFGINIEFRY